jgi:hypothetical protein
MSLNYTWEKLDRAVRYMATSPRDIRGRLEGASVEFSGLGLVPNAFPDVALAEEFKGICERLTRETPKGGEGSVSATLNLMSDDEAQELAARIFKLFHEIKTKYDEECVRSNR